MVVTAWYNTIWAKLNKDPFSNTLPCYDCYYVIIKTIKWFVFWLYQNGVCYLFVIFSSRNMSTCLMSAICICQVKSTVYVCWPTRNLMSSFLHHKMSQIYILHWPSLRDHCEICLFTLKKQIINDISSDLTVDVNTVNFKVTLNWIESITF